MMLMALVQSYITFYEAHNKLYQSYPSNEYLLVFGISRISINPLFPEKIAEVRIHFIILFISNKHKTTKLFGNKKQNKKTKYHKYNKSQGNRKTNPSLKVAGMLASKSDSGGLLQEVSGSCQLVKISIIKTVFMTVAISCLCMWDHFVLCVTCVGMDIFIKIFYQYTFNV